MANEIKFDSFPDGVVLPAVYGDRKGRHSSWSALIKKVSSMTVREAQAYFGEAAASLDSYSSDLPLRELMVFRAITDFLQAPSPSMLNLFMEREDGKVAQPIEGNLNVNNLDWRVLAEQLGVTQEEAMSEAARLIEQLNGKAIEAPVIKEIPETIDLGQ